MDIYDLSRFVKAQQDVYESVVQELKRGQKCGHWMWFVFPQLLGLGRSKTSQFYAIRSVQEAGAYADHNVLGTRLRECTNLALDLNERTAKQIFGCIDARKFQSCMTLFAAVVVEETLFHDALVKYFDQRRDRASLRILGSKTSAHEKKL